MNFNKLKKKTEEYRDFYGQDIIFIEPPKTVEDLRSGLWSHHNFLQQQNVDALSHLEEFMSEVGAK